MKSPFRRRTALRLVLSFLALATVPGLLSQTGTHRVLDGVYTNAGTTFLLGDGGSFNTLVITNQGWLENINGIVGNLGSSRSNVAWVTGPQSLWQNVSAFYLGGAGSANQLIVSNAAEVVAGLAAIGGAATSSNNSVTVVGSSSVLRAGTFMAGDMGWGNQIVITGGAFLNTASLGAVGYRQPGGNNTLRLIGPVSAWQNSLDVSVGTFESTSNDVAISKGGLVSGRTLRLGNGRGNRITLTDSGTLWQVSEHALIGNEGSDNRLLITNGARFTATSVVVSGDRNAIIVAGPGSLFSTAGESGQLAVGTYGADNVVLATGGGRVVSRAGYLLGHRNRAEISGPGSVWENAEFIQVGEPFESGGALRVADGGRLSTVATTLSGDGGRLEISGAGSRLDGSGLFSVGDEFGASNQLFIAEGGRLHCSSGYVGGRDSPFFREVNTGNNAVVTGAGSLWRNTNNLIVGVTGGSSRLSVSNGAAVHCLNGYVGFHGYSGNNAVIVTGANSLWSNEGSLVVGYAGSANRLLVADGAQLQSASGAIGRQYNQNNAAMVVGPGARWTLTGQLIIGNSGSGNLLLITNAGQVASATGAIDAAPGTANPGRSNVVVVTGPGSLWSIAGGLTVGAYSSVNTLTVADGATVQAGSLQSGNAASSFSNSIVIAGGQLILTNATGSSALTVVRSAVTLDGGSITADRLQADGGVASVFQFNSGAINVRSASVANGRTFSIGSGAPGSQLTLRRGAHGFANGLVAPPGTSLNAAGILNANVTNSGALTVGAQADTLVMTAGLRLENTASVTFDLGGPVAGSQHDFIQVSNLVRFGGLLRLTFLNNYLPTSNTVITLMSFGGASGAFDNAPHGARVNFENSPVGARVEYTGTSLRLVDFHNAAPSANPIDDAWALQYFGHAPLTDEERTADNDGDGVNTYTEYVAGTDPFDSNSLLRITSFNTNLAGQVVIRFSSVPDRQYGISYSSNLTEWSEILPITVTLPEEGLCEWLDDGSQTGGLPAPPALFRRFYRISVRR